MLKLDGARGIDTPLAKISSKFANELLEYISYSLYHIWIDQSAVTSKNKKTQYLFMLVKNRVPTLWINYRKWTRRALIALIHKMFRMISSCISLKSLLTAKKVIVKSSQGATRADKDSNSNVVTVVGDGKMLKMKKAIVKNRLVIADSLTLSTSLSQFGDWLKMLGHSIDLWNK